MADRVKILVPGDEPQQIGGSPQLARLEPHGDLTLYDKGPESSQEKISRADGFDIILNSRGVVEWREVELRQLPALKMIATCSIGTDMIDLDVARELNIVVSNQPGRTAPVVAEHMFGLMFTVAKRAAFQTNEIISNRLPRRMNLSVQGKVLGIVGAGNIGAEMARLGNAIGMDVNAWTFNPSDDRAEQLGVRFVNLEELLAHSDYVSIHTALTDDTRGLIGFEELRSMKANAVILNGARGAVLDIDALGEVLESGHLGGAGLDVFEEEPFIADHPLKKCEQVVFTPHAADQTPEGIELLNGGAVDNILAFLAGNPANNVAE